MPVLDLVPNSSGQVKTADIHEFASFSCFDTSLFGSCLRNYSGLEASNQAHSSTGSGKAREFFLRKLRSMPGKPNYKNSRRLANKGSKYDQSSLPVEFFLVAAHRLPIEYTANCRSASRRGIARRAIGRAADFRDSRVAFNCRNNSGSFRNVASARQRRKERTSSSKRV